MSTPGRKIGKIDEKVFSEFVLARCGRKDPRLLVGPRTGVDAAVLRIGDTAVVIAEDPIFPAVGLPLDTFGFFTVHIGASDVAVMGVKPEFATYTLLMPPGTPDEDLRTIVDSIHAAAEDLGICIAGGHTGYYPVVTVPIVGGITVIGTGRVEDIVTPAGARPGDVVLLTKGPAIEATGLLAVLYEERIRRERGDRVAEAALARCRQISVVRDALAAKAGGPVTAMHDATEGGVLGGLFEIAAASGVGMEVNEQAMPFPEDVEAVCGILSIDPLAAIAEGTLLVTVPEAAAPGVLAAVRADGTACEVVGRVTGDPARRVIRRRDGREEPLAVPAEDPFWPAFFRGVESYGRR